MLIVQNIALAAMMAAAIWATFTAIRTRHWLTFVIALGIGTVLLWEIAAFFDAARSERPWLLGEGGLSLKSAAVDAAIAVAGLGVAWAVDRWSRGELARQRTTEQRRAMEEERFRRMIEGSEQGVWALDRNVRTTYVNERMAQMMGYTREEMVGRHIFDFMTERGRAEAAKYISNRERGVREQHDFVLVRKDGSEVWLLITANPVYDEHGEYAGSVAMIADMTSRRKKQQELEKAHRILNYHIDNSPFAVIEWDREFRLIRWSRQAERIFGWRADEVLGKHPTDWPFIFDEDVPAVQRVMDELMSGAQPRNFSKNRNYTKRNGVITCEWHNSALLDEDGELVSIFSLAEDVTPRERAEEGQRESELRFQQLAASIDQVFWITQLNPARTVYLSPAFRSVWGVPPEEFFQDREAWPRSIHPADREKTCRSFDAWLDGPMTTGWDCAYRIVRPDGSTRWVHDRATAARSERGEVIGVVGVSEDVTASQARNRERAELLQELEARARHSYETAMCVVDGALDHARSARELAELAKGTFAAVIRTNELLSRNDWTGVRMAALTQEALRPFTDSEEGLVLLKGPDLVIPARAATPLSVVLHELGRDAARDGALASEGGRVEISWRLAAQESGAVFRMEWRERYGRARTKGERDLTDRDLFACAVGTELEGVTRVEQDAMGLRFTLEARLDDAIARSEPFETAGTTEGDD
ncbi:MAG: PAS domain S-box protein [Planctomycetota bacterium]|nr:PAS domain S-box protein [Planctomycetota bacterium]